MIEHDYINKIEIYCKNLINNHYSKTGIYLPLKNEMVSEGFIDYEQDFEKTKKQIKNFFFKEYRIFKAKKQNRSGGFTNYHKTCKDCKELKHNCHFHKLTSQEGLEYLTSRCVLCYRLWKNSKYNPEKKRIRYLKKRGDKRKMNMTPVIAVNNSGVKKKFDSVKKCAEYLGCHYVSVSRVLSGERKQVKKHKIYLNTDDL